MLLFVCRQVSGDEVVFRRLSEDSVRLDQSAVVFLSASLSHTPTEAREGRDRCATTETIKHRPEIFKKLEISLEASP